MTIDGSMRRARFFHFGDWLVDRETCLLTHDTAQEPVPVEPRAMEVLVALCTHAGEILSADALLHLCWDGVIVGENQVHKAIAQLRRILGDSAGNARYIENIRKRGYRTVASVEALHGMYLPGRAGSWPDSSPFVGLDPFTENYAAVFFGRDDATARLCDAVDKQIASGRALVLVLGASGSGKTSLVQAGLIPALRRPDRGLQLVATTTLDLGDIGKMPLMTAIGSALLDLEVNGDVLLSGQNAEGIGSALATAAADVVSAALGRMFPDRTRVKVVVFVDRLEALFNAPTISERDRSDFLLALDCLASGGAAIVIAACRNDFYSNVAREPVLMQGKSAGSHFDLAPPTRAQIAQMIRRPALAAGLTFGVDPRTAEQLDDTLCEGTAENPDALPLLQYTLHELYLQRSNNRELTVAAYRALGGIGGAIGKRAEATLNRLPERSQALLPRILSLIVTVNDESVRSRRIPWSALANDHERTLVHTFVEHRLFVSLVYDGEAVFGVAHEALLRQWPRVAAWISDHRQALHTRSRLEESARRWVWEGRSADLLLPRGKLLEEARELLGPAHITLNAEVTSLIAASVQKARQADQRRIGVLIGFAVIALCAVALGLRAHHAETVAEQRRREAEGLMDFMVGDLADKLRPLGRLDLLAGIGAKALGYFGDVRPADLPPAARKQQARALQTIGEVARSRSDPNGARRALLLAKTLLDTNLSQGHESAELLKDLGADAFWLGQIALDAGRLDESAGYFEQYQHYSERMLARDPDNVDAWVEISYASNSLGSVAQARGDNRAAATAFQRSIALKRRALNRRPGDHVLQADLADSLSWLGSARLEDGALSEAIELFNQEQAELTTLRTAAPTELIWTYRLVGAVQRHALLLSATGNDSAAADELRTNVALARALTQHDPTNRLWQKELLNVEALAADVRANLGDLPQALNLQIAAAAALARLTALDPTNLTGILIESANLINLGDTLLRVGRQRDAQEKLQKALDGLRRMTGRARDAKEFRQKVARGLVGLAQVHLALEDRTAALEACREAITTLQPLTRTDARNYETQDLWVRAHICVKEGDKVAATRQWLAQIGYRQAGYVRFLSQQQ
jgi:DNA-binding winged helix-turn-helix (wHTH) protein/tetratricopeptide (TPR) repeat protein/energy-coupling factor transporter ATP-binding protein EcfA2